MVMSENEIYGKIQKVLVDTLAVEEDEVFPEASLTGDLGAESIDFLDIAFQTEKLFGVKLLPEEMLAGNLLTEPYVQDGKVTDAGMSELRTRLPYLDLAALEKSRDVHDFRNAFTVNTLVQVVKAKLAISSAG